MESVRIGVVGLGNIGSVHAKGIRDGKVRGLTLSAVCDTDPVRLGWAENTLEGVPRFSGHREMLEANILDAVLVATPHYAHAPIAVDCFEKGLHVLSEKPAGVYTKQAGEMAAAAKRAGTVFAIMFNQRTDPIYRKIKELVAGGALGEPIRLVWLVTNWYRTQEYYDSGGWRATWAGEGGGVLINQAVHNLDLWQWIFGMPARVTANCGFGKYHDIEVEDDVTILAEYANGATGVFITSTGEYPGTNRLEIAGTKAKLVAEDGLLKIIHSNAENTGTRLEVFTPETADVTGHQAILQNFTDAVLRGEKLISPGEEGMRSLQISNAALLSAWENRPVTLPVDPELFCRRLDENIRRSAPRKKEAPARAADESERKKRWEIHW